jgi:hypothetical protein
MSWVTLMGLDHHGKMHPEPRDFELADRVNRANTRQNCNPYTLKRPPCLYINGLPPPFYHVSFGPKSPGTMTWLRISGKSNKVPGLKFDKLIFIVDLNTIPELVQMASWMLKIHVLKIPVK